MMHCEETGKMGLTGNVVIAGMHDLTRPIAAFANAVVQAIANLAGFRS